MSEQYTPDNLLDRVSDPDTLGLHYDHLRARERELFEREIGMHGGEVLSVGCGRDPGRHLFPKPAWRMTGVELEEEGPRELVASGELDEGFAGRAGELDGLADGSFDVVLYRYVLHHIAYQGSLAPAFGEAARLLRPGGALIAMEPGTWHPVGAGLTLANRVGAGTAVHGTPDDVPLRPGQLAGEARAAGLAPRIHAVTYSWRRLPPIAQRLLWRLDGRLGSRPVAAKAGHTLMLIASKPVD